MQAEKEATLTEIKVFPKNKTYATTWQQFTNKGMELLVDNPTTARYVLKYVPKTHKFLLKITDGQQIVMKKCKGEELDQIQKFTFLAGRALTNELNKKVEEQVQDVKEGDKKKKHKKKR